MNYQVHLQNTLNQKLMEARAKNPAFSVRAFARRLEMQPSAVNEILKGERRVSSKLAGRIAERLQLNPTEKMNLLKDFPKTLKRKSKYKQGKDVDLQQMKLSTQQFDLISDWSHYAILNLTETMDFDSDPEAIAQRLGLSVPKIEEAIENLFSLGLLKKDENGTLKRTTGQTNTSDDVRNLSLQKMHVNDMEMAKEKLREVDVKDRDYTSYTLAFDPRLMPKVKELIRRFQDDADELMKDAEPTEVYKMNTYLYPLTKLNKNSGESK